MVIGLCNGCSSQRDSIEPWVPWDANTESALEPIDVLEDGERKHPDAAMRDLPSKTRACREDLEVVRALGADRRLVQHATTTLTCESNSTPPEPQSSKTWIAGCPTITPQGSETLTLAAN